MNSIPEPTTSPRRAMVVRFHRWNTSFLGAYGNEWIRTRTIDRLASRGVVFDQHFATTTLPGPAESAWRETIPDLIQRLNRAGVCTIRIQQTSVHSPDAWVMDEVISPDPTPWKLLGLRQATYRTLAKVPPDAPALLWIDLDPYSTPWHAARRWTEYFFAVEADEEPIEPWFDHLPASTDGLTDQDLERIQTTYAAVTASIDHSLARLLRGCRARGFGQSGLTVLTAVLGEPLGENSHIGRKSTAVAEALVHLPLIIRWPNNQGAGRRCADLTEPSDLASMLAEYFGLLPTDSPAPRLSFHAKRQPPRSFLAIRAQTEWGLRTEERLLIAPTPMNLETARLYLKPGDRWEYNDLARKREAEVELLLEQLGQFAGK